jgi:cell division control protein 6
MAELCKELGKEVPPTGLPTQEIYRIFISALTKQQKTIILVLDEIDQLVKKAGDNILYNLVRMNEDVKGSQVGLIGISNDLTFIDHIDPRARSSLSEEEIIFPPYNALQIQHILKQRAEVAFKPGVIEQGVVEKCAALAAREHGDARRALELLRVAGEIAERNNAQKVSIIHLDEADEKIDRDRFLDIINTQPKQHQLVLHAILSIQPRNSTIFTGEIYNLYKELSARAGLRPLTQRRVSDILGEFDMLGIINAKVISKGRYGRMREIAVSLPTPLLPKIKELLKEQL